jgi:hypothetical protein
MYPFIFVNIRSSQSQKLAQRDRVESKFDQARKLIRSTKGPWCAATKSRHLGVITAAAQHGKNRAHIRGGYAGTFGRLMNSPSNQQFPEVQKMRKILLASVAAIPLFSIYVSPAPAQQLREKSGSSMSQPQSGDEARDKTSAQGRTEQSRPNSGGEGAAKTSGSQDKTEGRASSGSRDEHPTVGQDQRGGGKSASDGKSEGEDQLKFDHGKAAQGKAKDADQAKAKDQSKDQAKSRDQDKSRDSADQARSQGQANAKDKDEKQTGTNQSKGNPSTGANGTQKQVPTTTGQAPRSNEPNARNEENRRDNDPNKREGQNGRDPQNNRDAQTGRSEQGGSQSQADASGSVTLTDEQRTKIRETVLSGRDVPREDRVNFEIEVGRPVPREVRIREVPTTLVEIYPEWRGHEYFVVNDEIVIVDRSRRIVSRVPVGSSSGSVETRRSSSTSVEVTYSPEEIRRVQEVLIDKGFYKGRPDGVMSVEFKDALISFQRREGIEVTGRIDERTATSLGVSIRTEGQASGREDGNRSGQQGARDNDQKSGQTKPNNNDKPATSGQAGNAPNSGQNNPSTSGKDGNAKAQGSANDPNQKSENAPSGDTSRQPPQQRPSTSGQGGTSSSTNQDSPSQGGPSFRPTNPSTPSGQGRDGTSEQRKQP